MITFLKKVWYWLKYSSTNADNISLTFKGLATMIVPILLYIANVYKWNIDSGTTTTVVDGIASAIIVVGGFIGSAVATAGAIRKIWTSITGTNEVIAGFRD
jgi:hypothetical protein